MYIFSCRLMKIKFAIAITLKYLKNWEQSFYVRNSIIYTQHTERQTEKMKIKHKRGNKPYKSSKVELLDSTAKIFIYYVVKCREIFNRN